MNFRKLKIVSKGQRRTYDNYVHVPEIKLEGKWLEKLGFDPDSYREGGEIIVKQQKGKLTITPKKRDNE